MIDMHSHILPNIDDGAKSIEETNRLIKEAKNVGFEAIITTPHYMEGYYEIDEKERSELVNKFQTDVKLYVGNEIYLSDNIIKFLEDKKASTINNTKYVLFEMPMNVKPMNLFNTIYEMLQHKLIPILAHPERYVFVQKEPELICELIQNGILMQANYGSIVGEYGKRAQEIVQVFLKNNMIHFLGTDVHKSNTVYPKMPQVIKKIVKIIGKDKFNELSNINPKLVLENKNIEIEVPEKIKITLKERLVLKI